MDTNTTATVTRTSKGFHIAFEQGHTANVGPNFTHIVLYSRGGWNPNSDDRDRQCFSKHKSLAAAQKEARSYSQWAHATYEIVDTTTL